MLFRKTLREMKRDWGHSLSVLLLAFLAVAMFCTFEGHVIAQHKARAVFHDACSLSDLWVYGEGFTRENLEAVRELDFVEGAQLRTSVTGSAPDCDGAQVDLYLERENLVNQPYTIDGDEFDPEDTEGVWLANAFAARREIQVGDDFTIEYNGITFTRTVRGLIESAEYEYRQADGDADVYLENIAIAYMSYDAFPIREYVEHLIGQEKITAADIAENSESLGGVTSLLKTLGLDVSGLSKEMLLHITGMMSDETLGELMPYTELVIRTVDDSGLAREDAVAEALEGNYAAMVDENSIPGLARLNSELEQHESFSYLFVVIFAGIAMLVIATSMSRMVERQRIQIGTMNALGMKQYKVIFHYISYSLFVALAGGIIGIVTGTLWLSPLMINLFAEYYIVPGLKAGFDISYVWVGLLVAAICALSAFLSCRKLLRIRPAQALRPAPPRGGKHCIFEKLPFWEKLGFNGQYNLRDISRAKLRAGMCILGTAVGMLLMVYGVACNSLVNEMSENTFEKIQPAQWQMKLSADAALPEVDEIAEETSGELVMVSQIEVSKKENAVSAEKKKEAITVLEGKGLYNILDTSQNVASLEAGSIGISRKLASDLGIQVGDTICWHLYSQNDWHEATVGMIYQNAETQGIAYLREDFEKTGETFTPSWLYSDTDLSGYAGESSVISVDDKQSLMDAYAEAMESVNMMVWMMIIFAVLLILVVLYNSGNLSFHERIREFATLKVLGFQSGRIRKILSVQNFWLSAVGILLGAPFGKMSFNAMMNSNGDNFDYNLSIHWESYLISAVLVLVVSVLISFLFSKRIRRLDMVEVLKGVE